ncbi:ABC transporter permease [Demequina sp. NBRC 110054]|uniref:ABC transporter permease n=1 Tax=Demequina sp. NBRC 110054 TaxID=1570343 RepID=UPI000A058CAC|nr:ABC transporter permease [Demequina sp. NBRC 110054]
MSAATDTTSTTIAAPAPSDSGRIAAWRLLLRNPVTVASAVVLLAVIVIAFFGQALAPYGINDIDVPNALQGPSSAHWFGTDDLGRDVLSRVLVATAVSLKVAVVSVGIAFLLGVTAGVVSGFVGGWFDTVMMRVVDVMFAFPVILLALAIISILGPGIGTTMVAIGIVYTPIFARVARASALSVSVEPFVQVSRTMGTPSRTILVRHVLPNITAPIIVQTSLSLAFAILSEASLSFLGLGVQPPDPSWGRMLYDAQAFLGQAWWLSVFPGAAIFVTVLAFNLVGDGLRDVLDPKQRSIMEARARR